MGAMLTGCVSVVPAGHSFHQLIVHGETGFVCRDYREFKECVRELRGNCPLRERMARQAGEHARTRLCNAEEHRRVWLEALRF